MPSTAVVVPSATPMPMATAAPATVRGSQAANSETVKTIVTNTP